MSRDYFVYTDEEGELGFALMSFYKGAEEFLGPLSIEKGFANLTKEEAGRFVSSVRGGGLILIC